MRLNNVEIAVTVKGRPITEYTHNGQNFIEGREDSKFEIKVTNHNTYRVEAIVAVDGLSILDGKDAGPESQGYLLNAGETIAIPGWKLNESQVAAFVFSGKDGSYSALTTGSARNTGVIGLLAYRERHVPMHPYTSRPHYGGVLGHTQNLNAQIGGYDVHSAMAAQPFNGNPLAMGGVSMGLVHNTMTGASVNNIAMASSVMRSAVGAKGPQGPQGPKGDPGAPGPAGVSPYDIPRYYGDATASASLAPEPASLQNLGTSFGEATSFATTAVQFNRGDMQAMIVLYYDNARGLKARGITLTRTKKDAVLATPNAFPGMSGCVPPKGWNG